MSKYQRWYDEIIERAKVDRDLDGYSERHHILPRCLGGGDEPTNLVDLTYREHFLVHWLLIKIYDGEARRPLVYAVHCMTMALSGRIISSWQFDVAKRVIRAEVLKKAAARRARRELELAEAVRKIETSEQLAAQLRKSGDRHELGALANHWLKWRTAARRSRTARGLSRGKVPVLIPNRDEVVAKAHERQAQRRRKRRR